MKEIGAIFVVSISEIRTVQLAAIKRRYNDTLFKYIYAHKHDMRYICEKVDREVIPIKGPQTEL